MLNKLKIFTKSNIQHIKVFLAAFCSFIAVHIVTMNLSSKSAWHALLSGAFASAISIMFYSKN